MTPLKLYNSLTRQKETFTPIDPAHVRLYACGPTVYSYAHIGNARMAVVFDVLVRLLHGRFPKVTYVSNITDVDDKIMAAARESGEKIEDITRKYERIYNADMASLGVATPDVQPRATEHIPQMITIIEQLIAKKNAYAADGHVLFHVPSFPAYGSLSGRSRDEQIAGARVEVATYKKDPADFVLWKPSTPDEPGWNSPWGRGRPGWHIECSAMAEVHLKLPFDIHGGGADLKFPHHENEIAQSCCAGGNMEDMSSFAKMWVHNGFVTVEGEKMSKSIGNVVLAHDLIGKHKGETLRLTLLSAHYRQPLDWTEDAIHQSQRTLDRLYQYLRQIGPRTDEILMTDCPIQAALHDDLNTPLALSLLLSVTKEAVETKSPVLKSQVYAAANILGILQHNPEEWLGYSVSDNSLDVSYIENLLQQRTVARKEKNFKRSDEIRDELQDMGIAIEDTPQGTKWKKIV